MIDIGREQKDGVSEICKGEMGLGKGVGEKRSDKMW